MRKKIEAEDLTNFFKEINIYIIVHRETKNYTIFLGKNFEYLQFD